MIWPCCHHWHQYRMVFRYKWILHEFSFYTHFWTSFRNIDIVIDINIWQIRPAIIPIQLLTITVVSPIIIILSLVRGTVISSFRRSARAHVNVTSRHLEESHHESLFVLRSTSTHNSKFIGLYLTVTICNTNKVACQIDSCFSSSVN